MNVGYGIYIEATFRRELRFEVVLWLQHSELDSIHVKILLICSYYDYTVGKLTKIEMHGGSVNVITFRLAFSSFNLGFSAIKLQ